MTRLNHIPTKAQYVTALQNLLKQDKVNDLQRTILSVQYWAPNHTAGAAELGEIVGYDVVVVNNHYGRLGHLIVDEIGFKSNQRYSWWEILAEGWNNQDKRFIWRMHIEVAQALEELGLIQQDVGHFSQEIVVPDNLTEGAVRRITVNSYERNSSAKRKCVEHFGAKCVICGFDFGEMYGPLGENYIHVHHLKPLSEIKETYEVDPINDLRPVCPNCHAIIHLKNPPLTIEQVKNLISVYGNTFSKPS